MRIFSNRANPHSSRCARQSLALLPASPIRLYCVFLPQPLTTTLRTLDCDMTVNSTDSRSSVDGLRTLELGSALLWIREQLQQQLEPGVHSISLSGARTPKQQQILGMSQILLVMFPFAIELAIKSLWNCFHQPGTYERRHDLDVLFQSLDQNAMDAPAARLAQQQARDLWLEFRNEKKIHHSGTLDAFLSAHSRDFVELRYYAPRTVEYVQIEDFVICFYCIVYPLAARDPATFANLCIRAVSTHRNRNS